MSHLYKSAVNVSALSDPALSLSLSAASTSAFIVLVYQMSSFGTCRRILFFKPRTKSVDIVKHPVFGFGVYRDIYFLAVCPHIPRLEA